jgi:O-antigen ligase/tetratricopeptide (TPR) repeat protein
MIFGRTMIFEIIIEILFLLLIFYFLFKKEFKFNWNLLDKLVVVFLFILFIAAIFGVDFQLSFFGNMMRVQGVFTWWHFGLWYFILRFLFSVIYKEDGAAKYGLIFLKSVGITSLLVTFSAFFAPLIPYLRNQVGGWGRISGTIGNPIFFASYLILPIFLNCYLIYLANRRERYFWIFVVLLEIFALIQSGTRGAIVGFVVGVIFLSILGLIYSRSSSFKSLMPIKQLKTFFIVCLLVIFLAGSLVAYLGFTQKRTGIAIIDRLTEIISLKGTGATRLMAWEIAWQSFLEKPIFGFGPENFKFVFHRHYNPDYLTYGFYETVFDKPHNLILEFAATSGIFGVLGYLGIFAAAFHLLFKRRSLFSVILAAGLMAYFIQNLFIFETSNSLIIFFLVLALIPSVESHEPRSIGAKKDSNISIKQYNNTTIEDRTVEKWFGLKVFGFVIFIILICFSLWNYHIKPLYASYFLSKAGEGFYKNNFSLWLTPVLKSFEIEFPQKPEALEVISRDLVNWDTKYQVSNKEMAKILPVLAKHLERQIKIQPNHFVYYFWLGQVYSIMCERSMPEFANLGAPLESEPANFAKESKINDFCEKADETFSKAIEVAPERQDVKLLLAKVKLLKKDFEAAVKINQELVDLQPDLAVTHWFLGLSLVSSGRKDEGIRELEKGAGYGLTTTKNVLYMIDLYSEKKEYNKIVELYKRLIRDTEALEAEGKIGASSAVLNMANWWARLAATYAAMGDKEKAEEAVARAVELNPALEEEAKVFLQKIKE